MYNFDQQMRSAYQQNAIHPNVKNFVYSPVAKYPVRKYATEQITTKPVKVFPPVQLQYQPQLVQQTPQYTPPQIQQRPQQIQQRLQQIQHQIATTRPTPIVPPTNQQYYMPRGTQVHRAAPARTFFERPIDEYLLHAINTLPVARTFIMTHRETEPEYLT